MLPNPNWNTRQELSTCIYKNNLLIVYVPPGETLLTGQSMNRGQNVPFSLGWYLEGCGLAEQSHDSTLNDWGCSRFAYSTWNGEP